MRPGSRGYAGGGLQPPGTGMRMATAQRGGRPMSGRMRTGQVTAGPSREAAYGVALSQEVKIADRPVTQQGMSGMKTAGGGGIGRQVQDASFFIGVLRSKMNDIRAEISRLRAEIERHEKELSQQGHLERTYETLLQEVKTLEGTLADYNLAVDKARTTADPGEVAKYLHELEDQNRREARGLDDIFLAKQQHEKDTQDLEGEMEAVHRRMEDKINTLEPEKLHEYRVLLQRNHDLQSRVAQKQAEADHLAAQIGEHEARSQGQGSAALRAEYAQLDKSVGSLRRERENLQQDLEISTMSPKEARERLLSKVKADQERLKQLDVRTAETASEIESMKRRLADFDSDMKADKKGDVAQNKARSKCFRPSVEVLQKRDQEMTEFIERFDQTKDEALVDQKSARSTIVGLLEHISQGLDAQHHIPEQSRMRELEDENSFKGKQLKSSEMTRRRLQQDKERRQQEMDKIDTLDEKARLLLFTNCTFPCRQIPLELANMKEKISKMIREMKDFEDIDGLRDQATRTKEHLQGLKTQYRHRVEAMRGQVQQLTARHEISKKELAASETGERGGGPGEKE
ncbi:unnamed protein product, partial [Sphacelaria rigidula]